MVRLVRCRVGCLQLFLANCVDHIALLTEIEIETVVALVSHADNGHHLATMTLNILSNLLPWLYN